MQQIFPQATFIVTADKTTVCYQLRLIPEDEASS